MKNGTVARVSLDPGCVAASVNVTNFGSQATCLDPVNIAKSALVKGAISDYEAKRLVVLQYQRSRVRGPVSAVKS